MDSSPTAFDAPAAQAASLLQRYEDLPAFISVQQAAKLTGLCRSTAYRAVERGELPVVRMGGRMLVPVGALLTLMGLIQPLPATETAWLADPAFSSR